MPTWNDAESGTAAVLVHKLNPDQTRLPGFINRTCNIKYVQYHTAKQNVYF